MKKLLLTIFISILTIALYAQNQYATTTNGKKVLLKNDGTWEYVKDNTTSTNSLHSPVNKPTSSSTNSSNIRKKSSSTKKPTGRTYIRGPRGGCYYINSNGNKTYVDRSLCN